MAANETTPDDCSDFNYSLGVTVKIRVFYSTSKRFFLLNNLMAQPAVLVRHSQLLTQPASHVSLTEL